MMSTFNWGELVDAAGAGIQPIPDGEYELQVNSAVVKPTSTGKVNIQVRFNVVAGPHTTRPVWNNFTLSPENPNALGYFFRDMNAMGLTAEYFRSNPTPETVAEALIGKLVHAVVGHETYKMELRNTIGKFSPSQLAGQAVPSTPAPLAAPTAVVTPMAPPVPVIAAPSIAPVAPVAAAPSVALSVAPAPAAVRQFDPATGMEWNGTEWVWPPEKAAGMDWTGAEWVTPLAVAPPAPPAPPAPAAPSIAAPVIPAVPIAPIAPPPVTPAF